MKKNEIIKDRLEEWVESKGFLNSRFTIIELCKIIGTLIPQHFDLTLFISS